jgi:hypothetical protein
MVAPIPALAKGKIEKMLGWEGTDVENPPNRLENLYYHKM